MITVMMGRVTWNYYEDALLLPDVVILKRLFAIMCYKQSKITQQDRWFPQIIKHDHNLLIRNPQTISNYQGIIVYINM